MNHISRFGFFPIVLLIAICFVDCTQPLNDGPNAPVEPAGGNNTTDTVYIPDTIVVTDTITIIDTVIVNPPGDTTTKSENCGRFGSQRKELVWLFNNDEGNYRLEFLAKAYKFKPEQVLIIDVNGETLQWIPADNPRLTLEKALSPYTVVKITPEDPAAFGHCIDICLWVTKL